MMGQQPRVESLFYYSRLEGQILEDHWLRLLDRYVDFSVVREINQYLLPEEEYRARQGEIAKAAEAAKKGEIQPGMAKEEVIKALGEPLKTIVFGKKTILKYQDITVELEDNKVVEVKAN